MKTIIIEDNHLARKFLTELLEEYCPNINLCGTASNIHAGRELIQKVKPELVFLDVEMPQGTGFNLLENIKNFDFQVIFTTAHEKYALQAIKYSALDYLLKPVDLDDLLQAVEKAEQQQPKDVSALKIQTLLQNLDTKPQNVQKLVLKDRYGMQIIKVQDIIRLEAEGSYTKFYLNNGKTLVISKSLKEYDNLLPTTDFFRSHQSHLVNMEYLERYDTRDGDILKMIDGSEVPISRRKRDMLIGKIQDIWEIELTK